MTPLLELLNRVLAEALDPALDPHLAGDPTPEPVGTPAHAVQVRSVVLDEQGARVVLWLQPPAGEGEVVLRLQAEPPQGEHQRLALTLEQPPERWSGALEPFRRVLERARLHLELDFTP